MQPGWAGLALCSRTRAPGSRAPSLSFLLRLLLDWTCTPTTLTLNDWFKLEDISQALYFTTWNRKLRAAKRPGERQPRWLKLLQARRAAAAERTRGLASTPACVQPRKHHPSPSPQGALLFFGLVLLLWVPLLLFSSAAPTYVVPRVEAHAVNATLRAAGGAWQGSVAEFSLFSGGRQRQQRQFLPDNGSMPGDLTGTYVPSQFQLLCTAEVRWRCWCTACCCQCCTHPASSSRGSHAPLNTLLT